MVALIAPESAVRRLRLAPLADAPRALPRLDAELPREAEDFLVADFFVAAFFVAPPWLLRPPRAAAAVLPAAPRVPVFFAALPREEDAFLAVPRLDVDLDAEVLREDAAFFVAPPLLRPPRAAAVVLPAAPRVPVFFAALPREDVFLAAPRLDAVLLAPREVEDFFAAVLVAPLLRPAAPRVPVFFAAVLRLDAVFLLAVFLLATFLVAVFLVAPREAAAFLAAAPRLEVAFLLAVLPALRVDVAFFAVLFFAVAFLVVLPVRPPRAAAAVLPAAPRVPVFLAVLLRPDVLALREVEAFFAAPAFFAVLARVEVDLLAEPLRLEADVLPAFLAVLRPAVDLLALLRLPVFFAAVPRLDDVPLLREPDAELLRLLVLRAPPRRRPEAVSPSPSLRAVSLTLVSRRLTLSTVRPAASPTLLTVSTTAVTALPAVLAMLLPMSDAVSFTVSAACDSVAVTPLLVVFICPPRGLRFVLRR